MKKILAILSLFAFITFLLPSCSPKYGCPINESAHVQPNKKGKLPKKGGKSQLFPKDMRRKS